MKGLSKLDLEKVICCETTNEIWNVFESIYDKETQVAWGIKRPFLKNGAYKYLKSIEYYELEQEGDSPVTKGQVVDQHSKVSKEM